MAGVLKVKVAPDTWVPVGGSGLPGLPGPAGSIHQVATPTAVNTYTIALTDENILQEFTLNTAIALKVPTNAAVTCPIGFRFDFFQSSTGQITVSAVVPGTTTIIGTPSLVLRATGSAASLIKIATDRWLVVGDLA